MLNNYGQLLWKIEKVFKTKKAFCIAADIDTKTLNNYINGRHAMPATFISKCCKLLSIPTDEIGFYFFASDEDLST